MDDFNIGGDSYIIPFLIVTVVFGVIFTIDVIYEYMKYNPLQSMVLLLIILYGLYRIKISERINDKYWSLVPCFKWAIGIVAFVLIICLIMMALG